MPAIALLFLIQTTALFHLMVPGRIVEVMPLIRNSEPVAERMTAPASMVAYTTTWLPAKADTVFTFF